MARHPIPELSCVECKASRSVFQDVATIEQLTELTPTDQAALAALLQDAVAHGASLNFWMPLDDAKALAYWTQVERDLAAGTRLLFVAREGDHIVGTVQLVPSPQQNGSHRAEVQKLIVHSTAQGHGLGTALMAAIEDTARTIGRTLIFLDTKTGSVAEGLYTRLGYIRVGVIPDATIERDGSLHATVFFYRHLDSE